MCKLCDEGQPQDHGGSLGASRRDFLKASTATGVAAAGLSLFAAPPAAADNDDAPKDSGRPGRRYVIRGGHVMSMDPGVGELRGSRRAGRGQEDRRRRARTCARRRGGDRRARPHRDARLHRYASPPVRDRAAQLPCRRLLFNDGQPHGAINYFEYILGRFAPVYRPQDVYINELFGSLSQLDAGVTTVHDISQIHHSPEHSDAAIKGYPRLGSAHRVRLFRERGRGCRATSTRRTRAASRSSTSLPTTSSSR